jgi:hypothetical protein
MYFKIPYNFTILRFEFILHFSCHVKNVFFTTLAPVLLGLALFYNNERLHVYGWLVSHMYGIAAILHPLRKNVMVYLTNMEIQGILVSYQ